MVDPATMSYLLSSISSVGKILESIFKLREAGIIPSPEQYGQIEEEAVRQAGRPAVSDQIILSASISDEVVKVIRGEIDKIKERIKETYSAQGMGTYEKQQQADMCRREFCWNLNEIRKNNGGILPTDLQGEWDQNLCSTYKFI